MTSGGRIGVSLSTLGLQVQALMMGENNLVILRGCRGFATALGQTARETALSYKKGALAIG